MNLRYSCLLCIGCLVSGSVSTNALAAMIDVPNASFESPDASADPYYAGIPADDGSTVGQWLGYGQFYAVVKSGGPNGYNVSPSGIVGSQFGDHNASAGTGVFQDTAPYDGTGDSDLYWQPGSYTLTVGLFSREDNPVGADDELSLKLFYRVGGTRSGNATGGTLGTTVLTGDELSTSELTDYTVQVNVQPGADAVGLPIGIWLDSTSGSVGDWAYDNVRLEFSAVPEPSTVMLGGLAVLALLASVRRQSN